MSNYIVANTAGTKTITVTDGTINNETSLTLIGQNYINYGTFWNQDLLKLLENFSHTSAPTTPVSGQIWFDANNKILKVFDGSIWQGTGIASIGTTISASPRIGELYWTGSQLQVYNGSTWKAIGPTTGNLVLSGNIDAGNVTAANTITASTGVFDNLQVNNDFYLKHNFIDSSGYSGSVGQVITNSATGTYWADIPGSEPIRVRKTINFNAGVNTAYEIAGDNLTATLPTVDLVYGNWISFTHGFYSGNSKVAGNNLTINADILTIQGTSPAFTPRSTMSVTTAPYNLLLQWTTPGEWLLVNDSTIYGGGGSGTQGASGYSGISGYSGRSGYSGATGVGTSGFSGYSGTSSTSVVYTVINTTSPLTTNSAYWVTASSITLTLPSSPVTGNYVIIASGAIGVTNITIAQASAHYIQGYNTNLLINTTDFYLKLVYRADAISAGVGDWRIAI